MKKTMIFALLASLAGWTYAQSQVDVAVLTVGAGVDGATNYATSAAKSSVFSSKASFSDVTVTYTYTAKLDDANTVKGGVIGDLYYPFVSGTDATYTAGQFAGKLEPFAQYQGFGVDAKFTFPIALAGSADKAGLNAAQALASYPAFAPVSAAGKFPIASNSVAVGNYEKVTYKYAFDKTTSIAAGYEADFVLVPTVFLADVLPQITAVYGPVQLDAKYSFYFVWADAVATGTAAAFKNYLEPKLTYDFGSLGVKGLKAYVAGKASLGQVKADGTSVALRDTRVQPGVSYSTTIDGVGTVGVDVSDRINKIDNDKTTYAGDVSPYQDIRLNLSYSVKF